MWKLVITILRVSRPLSWILTPLVFAMGVFGSGASVTVSIILKGMALSIPYSIFVYGINDVFDTLSDAVNPRKSQNFSEGISVKTHDLEWIKAVACTAGIFVFSVFLSSFNIEAVVICGAFLFISYFYSATPLRLKTRPPLDSLANGVIYFLGPVTLGFASGQTTLNIPNAVYWITLCVAGIHMFSTLADFTADKLVGDKTFAVAFGRNVAWILPLVIFAVSTIVLWKHQVVSWYLIYCLILLTVYPFKKTEAVARSICYFIYCGFIVAGGLELLLLVGIL